MSIQLNLESGITGTTVIPHFGTYQILEVCDKLIFVLVLQHEKFHFRSLKVNEIPVKQ